MTVAELLTKIHDFATSFSTKVVALDFLNMTLLEACWAVFLAFGFLALARIFIEGLVALVMSPVEIVRDARAEMDHRRQKKQWEEEVKA